MMWMLPKLVQFQFLVQCRHLCSKHSKWHLPEGYDTGVKVQNSLCSPAGSKSVTQLTPLVLPDGNNAKWYICGATMYDSAHIGHASSYVRFDIIRRILEKFFQVNVVQVMGVTDIDDKIIQRANEAKETFKTISKKYEREFFLELDDLKVLPASHYTRVTDHIPAIQRFISNVIRNGYAYATPSGSVYFDVPAFGLNRYGKLSFREMQNEEISESENREKRNSHDFVLWRAAKPEEPWWSSPWGKGRPGWHIECSAMSSATFGTTLDIHTGGMDLVFPHHTNEIAQCEACFLSDQWANYFLHTGHLFLKNNEDKMSKSLGNVILIQDFLRKYTANQFRIFCLMTRYSNNIVYSEESMQKAVVITNQITSFFNEASAYIEGKVSGGIIHEAEIFQRVSKTNEGVRNAFAENFDTPRALDLLLDLLQYTNKQLKSSKQSCSVRSPSAIAYVSSYISSTFSALGFQPVHEEVELSESQRSLPSTLDTLVSFRDDVRKWIFTSGMDGDVSLPPEETRKERKRRILADRAPLLETSDDVRTKLLEEGIQIKDREEGSTWEFTEKVSTKK